MGTLLKPSSVLLTTCIVFRDVVGARFKLKFFGCFCSFDIRTISPYTPPPRPLPTKEGSVVHCFVKTVELKLQMIRLTVVCKTARLLLVAFILTF